MNDDDAARLFEDWVARPFPVSWADIEVNPEIPWALAYVDAQCAGCLTRYFGRGLDDEYRQVLSLWRPEVELAIAAVDASARPYFEDLLSLVDHVLAASGEDPAARRST